MNDELIDETAYTALSEIRQKEFIIRSCREVVDLIDKAGSVSRAREIMNEHCTAFDVLCSSPLIRHAVRSSVEEHINVCWGLND